MPPHPLRYLRTHRGFDIAPAMGAPTGGTIFYPRESWFIVLTEPECNSGCNDRQRLYACPVKRKPIYVTDPVCNLMHCSLLPLGGRGCGPPIHHLEEYYIPQTVNARKPYQKIKVSYDFPSSFTMSSLGFLSKDKGFLKFWPFFVHVHAPHTYQRLKVS